ncbi:hypothetical protein [uncultured Massilia sp.]|uniref:hypothetical protein n=1 Tax=uncultured Massilia sp. TaxID=169973 RepID=UPI0025D91DE6|nr:hypothetical protein [uncultured Massilia sp.]
MQIRHLLAFAGAAILSLSAHAQQAPDQSAGSRVTVQGSQQGNASLTRLTVGEAEFMNRVSFRMEDGRILKLSNQGAKLYGELDGKREELVQVGPERFVGRRSGNSVAFDQLPFADTVVIGELRPDGTRISLAGR